MSATTTTTVPLAAVEPAPFEASAAPWRVFAIACAAVFLVSVDATVLYAAFPAMRGAFPGASRADLSWVLNAYTIVYAALLVPAGRVADLRGRKRTFIGGTAAFLAASLACGLAPSVGLLVAARALQAVGAALLLPASISITLAAFPQRKRAIAVAAWGAVSGLGAALGPSLGSLLVQRWGWPWAFFVNLPIGAVALWRASKSLEESTDPEKGAPLDVVGVALVIIGVASIAFGLVRVESAGFASPSVGLPLLLGVVSLVVYAAWSKRVAAPAIDLSLFEDRTYRYVNLATLAFGIAFAMMFFSFFLFMTGVWHFSIAEAGLAAMPGPLAVVPTSILGGRFAARRGHRWLLVVGGLVFAAGALWAATIPTAQPDYLHTWLPSMLMTGVGTGMVMPSLSGAAVAQLPAARFGVGSAVNQAVRQVGSVLGVALAVVFLGPRAEIGDFRRVFVAEVLFAVMTAALSLPVDGGEARTVEARLRDV